MTRFVQTSCLFMTCLDCGRWMGFRFCFARVRADLGHRVIEVRCGRCGRIDEVAPSDISLNKLQ